MNNFLNTHTTETPTTTTEMRIAFDITPVAQTTELNPIEMPGLQESVGAATIQPLPAPAKVLDPRPKIELSGKGRLTSDVAMELGQVLAPHGIYLFAGEAAVYEKKENSLHPIKASRFTTWEEQFVIPIKTSGKKGEEIRTMSSSEAGAVLVSPQFLYQLREVERVNRTPLPVMRASGQVELLPEGYDRESKILTAHEANKYPTNMPVSEAKAFLDNLFAEFPFRDDRSKAISIAAMLTLFGLDLMPARTILPVFMYRGNLPGLGKGLLAQAAIIPILGYAPTGVKPSSETEMRKVLFSVAKEGRPVVVLDNVTGPLASPSLESFVTTSTVTGRVLGSSTSLNCRKNSVVFVTGNNCVLNGDMTRRTLVAELFMAGDPGERTIENHLDENKLLDLSPQILAALYALVRDWAEAGKPGPAQINPNFVAWSKVIGGIVEHAGMGCVVPGAATQAVADTKDADMITLVEGLHEVRKTEAVKFSDLVALMKTRNLFGDTLKAGGMLTKQENTTLGRFLSTQHNRIFAAGLRFVIIGKGHARRYAVQRLDIAATA